jgi:hypothetical protein
VKPLVCGQTEVQKLRKLSVILASFRAECLAWGQGCLYIHSKNCGIDHAENHRGWGEPWVLTTEGHNVGSALPSSGG